MYSSGSSTPDLGYYKLPPIITTEADREFLNEVNAFIDSELEKVDHLDEEQRYLIYKTVFNKVIEHVTAYKPVLVQIKREYEDTIDTIKKGQREATFLQEKLKAMASEPSTLRNYRKRGDELEERIAILRKKNEQLQQELQQIQVVKEEKEKRPKSAEKPERELKKDSRLIPGLSIEESTDMKVLQKKHETLDRQLKELSLSLRARFLPKTHKLQLKESLDNKVTYRDQLLWQSQVYKARGQKLKIALEAAQAYNQMKPPHQTVGDAVTIAFQHALGMLKAEREKTEGEQADANQTTTFEDDDPNKEKEAEMMLEYIEKFNELFEDGLYEEAAVHAANSPKGILRTQATLAKFRDVKVKTKGRSPLLAFCDSIMSSVRAAGSRPNEALSMDCMAACLKENRLDLAYHWLSQDRLTQSVGLGKIISEHCSCPLPCKCGCQALAQSVFAKMKCHQDVVLTMLKQGKSQGALLYVRHRQCINDENIATILSDVCNQNIVTGLLERDSNGKKCLPDLNLGSVLQALVDLEKTEMVSNLIQVMLKPSPIDEDSTTGLLDLQNAVMQDTTTTPDQWMVVLEALNNAGFQDSMYQLLAMTFVVDVLKKAWETEQERSKKESVSFSEDVIDVEKTGKDDKKRRSRFSDVDDDDDDDDNDDENGKLDDTKESSVGLSSRSRDDTNTSMDHSSRETSPEIGRRRGQVMAKESILKKKHQEKQPEYDASSSECSPRKSPQAVRKRVVRMSRKKGGVSFSANQSDEDEGNDSDCDNDDKNTEKSSRKRKVRMNLSPNKSGGKSVDEEENKSRVKFNDDTSQVTDHVDDRQSDVEKEGDNTLERMGSRVSFEIQEKKNETEGNESEKKLEVKFEMGIEEEERHTKLNETEDKSEEKMCEEEKLRFDMQVDTDMKETTTEAGLVDDMSELKDATKHDFDDENTGGDDSVKANERHSARVRFADNDTKNDEDVEKMELNGNPKDENSSRVRFVDNDAENNLDNEGIRDYDAGTNDGKLKRVGFAEDCVKGDLDQERVGDNDDNDNIKVNNSPRVKFVDECINDENDDRDDKTDDNSHDETKQAVVETTENCNEEENKPDNNGDDTVDTKEEKEN